MLILAGWLMKSPACKSFCYFLEGQAGVELLLHPLRLRGCMVDPAGLFAAATAVEHLWLGQEAELHPAADRAGVDAGRLGDLLRGDRGAHAPAESSSRFWSCACV